jgi:hypothetical protein
MIIVHYGTCVPVTGAFFIVHFFLSSVVTRYGTIPVSCLCVGLICVARLVIIILFSFYDFMLKIMSLNTGVVVRLHLSFCLN